MKNSLKYLPLFALATILFGACQNDKPPSYLAVEGETMGTYYKVTYLDSQMRDFKGPIDSLLAAVNQEISTYEPNSTVTQFNQAKDEFALGLSYEDYSKCVADPLACRGLKNRHFLANFLIARVANQRTSGNFDPTVMPLVNYWGFGYTPHKGVTAVDSLKIDSLMQYVGFEKVDLLEHNGRAVLKKSSPGVQLDFGGTGQGYGIDIVAELLELNGINNYLVDVGGECRARGHNAKGEWWTIGINTPTPESKITDFTRIVELKNLSVSTSGNYRNFHELDGQKYSHFISPFTGFPEKSTLHSASVFGKDCLLPDALATGFMVMGLDKAYALASQLEGIEALFIYSDENGKLQVKQTPGVEKFLK
ncbi:MAG: FAD:protein FMN transferase [Saprospiraceae bacterium]|nr:MAG: FAD:protein FMN transferase [Saprospiraceae bacterium]